MPHNPPRNRIWGTRFDPLPSSPPSSPPVQRSPVQITTGTKSDASFKKKDEKMSHDASIFVGSLPSNIEPIELSRLLREHLSEYAEIRHVKVIPSPQGFYAFVQCESADAATQLLNILNTTPPKLFQGRTLRFEAAHAYRTLRVSYRDPRAPGGYNGSQVGENQASLDLPFAMKVCSPRHAKTFILYNDAAVNSPSHDEPDVRVLHLQPVLCNAETVHQLVTHFGPLEHFGLYQVPPSAVDQENGAVLVHLDEHKSYPEPHDAPRHPNMDPRCWDIKFEHRDDCINALNALRTIPFVTATWAHNPMHDYRQYPRGNLRVYAHHVYERPPYKQAGGAVTPYIRQAPEERDASPQVLSIPISATAKENGSFENELDPLPTFSYGEGQSDTRFDWSMDLPALDNMQEDLAGLQNGSDPKNPDTEDESTPRPHVAVLATPLQRDSRSLNEDTPPGFDVSPISPRTPNFPSTPPDAGSLRGAPYNWRNVSGNAVAFYGEKYEKDVDKTTLYIPDLEIYGPNAWNEDKLRDYFCIFGNVKNVKVIRPVSAQFGFALVSFDAIDSASRAIAEQTCFKRVQHRDINPRRGGWRGRSRGRGFLTNNYRRPELARLEEGVNMKAIPNQAEPRIDDPLLPKFASLDLSSGALESGAREEIEGNFVHTPSREPRERRQSVSSPGRIGSASLDSASQSSPGNRDAPTAHLIEGTSLTSLPSAASSVLTTSSIASIPGGQPYPVVNTTYFPPAPWTMPHMPPQVHYGMHYYPGYTGYVLPGHPTVPGAAHSDPSTPTNTTPHYWPGMYAGFVPYHAYTQRSGDSTHPPHLSTRPPVPAIGHFQDEHRGLFPFYPQDVLNQYMAQYGNSPENHDQGADESRHRPCPSPSQMATPGNGPPSYRYPASWPHYSPMAPYTYPATMHPAVAGVPPRVPGQPHAGWMVPAGAGYHQVHQFPPRGDVNNHRRYYPGRTTDHQRNSLNLNRPSPAHGKQYRGNGLAAENGHPNESSFQSNNATVGGEWNNVSSS